MSANGATMNTDSAIFVCKILEREKGFQKKTIVAFTDSNVFILDFYIYILLLVSLFGLMFWPKCLEFEKAHTVSCQEALAQITNIFMQGEFLTN